MPPTTPLEAIPGLDWVDISTVPIMIALPSSHPLSRRRRIRREEMGGLPLVYFPRQNSPGQYDRGLAQIYGSAVPNIVRTEPSEERTLAAVAEGAGITLILAERTATLRYPGVSYRRFTDPEPIGTVGLAFRQHPSLAARRFIELARAMGRQLKPAEDDHS
jgi:DNA-binding transcriptional LysR family regulator